MMMIYVIVIIIIIVIPGSSVAMDLQHSTKQNPFLRAYSTIKMHQNHSFKYTTCNKMELLFMHG